jgi:hypothetical protein
MSEPILGPGDRYLEELADLKRRITDLERSRRLPFSTQRGGTWSLVPEDGSPSALIRFGVGADGDGVERYGMTLYDSDTDAILSTAENEKGLIYPQSYAQWVVPTAQSITSSSFVTVAECQYGAIDHDCMVAQAAITVAPATIAQARVLNLLSGVATNVVEVNGDTASGGTLTLNWLHPFTVGWGDNRPGRTSTFLLQWQVRRSAGSGAVNAWPPRSLTFLNRRFAVGESDVTPLQFA